MKSLIKSLLALSVSAAMLPVQAEEAVSYQIQELTAIDDVVNTYGVQQTNIGKAVVAGQTTYNFPIQFQYLDEDDFDSIVAYSVRNEESIFELVKIEGDSETLLRAGTPDANGLAWALRWLRSLSGATYQKYGDAYVYVYDNNSQQSTQLNVFDKPFPNTDILTRSTTDVAQGMTDDGWVFGYSSAPYLPLEPFDAGGDEPVVYWVSEFSQRGWISFDGQTVVGLTPLEDKYGGISAMFDVNSHRQAVGVSSVALNPNTLENIEAEGEVCDENADDYPKEVCIQLQRSSLYYSNAVMWQLDQSGSITDIIDLGTGVTNIDEDDERPYTSAATSINDDGLIVGYSHFWWDRNESNPSKTERVGQFAAVFRDSEVIDFTDRENYFESRALDINNQGMFTGYMSTYVNGKQRTKFFYANANDETITPIFPTDFFKGSASYPHAINENNIIVGEGEVETFIDSAQTPRRRHGFLYDIDSDSFYDVNQFLSCDDQQRYTIVEARDINENNEILATAWVEVDKRDVKGDVVDGEVDNVLRAVYLTPVGVDGAFTVNDCREELGQTVERKGAGMGLWSLLLLAIAGLRRRM
ncbi:DUF3466 family protein [Thalassotalea maritima]|uniref:DUF3466 family protein n=1 Tax=Thalassotalea maritima TaxID=3242416 RepID=UPI0035291F42